MALSWPAIEAHLRHELGDRLADLRIDPEPLGTASLAQVHRAVRKSDGLEIVLKIQYPGVAEAIDSDMGLFRNLLKLTRMVPQTREFDEWFEEVRSMMHRETRRIGLITSIIFTVLMIAFPAGLYGRKA